MSAFAVTADLVNMWNVSPQNEFFCTEYTSSSWCIKAIVHNDCRGGNLDRLNRSNWFPCRNVPLNGDLELDVISGKQDWLKLRVMSYIVSAPKGAI